MNALQKATYIDIAKRSWAVLAAGLLAFALIAGFGIAAQSSTSAAAPSGDAVSVTSAESIKHEIDSPPAQAAEILSDSELASLSDAEIESMLAEGEHRVAEAQREYAANSSPEDYAKAVTAYEAIKNQIDTIIETEGISGLRDKIQTLQEQSVSSLSIHTVASKCMVVHKWQLQTIAWMGIGFGAFYTIAGLFVSGTVVGLPGGAVVAALGVGLGVESQYFLWRVDQVTWTSKRVCF